jgi:hypothetical protein
MLRIIPGALAGLLLLTGQASAQETVLNGVLSGILPGSQVSWSSGVSRAGTETYEDLFVGRGELRLRADRVTVTPEGPVAHVEAEGVVVNLDSDASFSLELGSVSTSLSAPLIGAFRGVEGVPDLCRITAGGGRLEITGLRALRDVRREGARRVRSETSADRISLVQEVTPAGPGCEVRVSVDLLNAQEVRSDKSGVRVDQIELTLSLPGNVETLASNAAPPVRITAGFSGLLRQVPGGASVAVIQEGVAEAEITALSAVPALTAYLRGRGDTGGDRLAPIVRALIPGEVQASAALTGSTVLAEALLPADRISGLSRASLTNVIGDYRARVGTNEGRAELVISADLIGLGESALELSAEISPRGPDAPTLDLFPRLEPFLPRAHLEAATLRHRDLGLLRAIELISGSPVSVLAAIYLQDGLDDMPEAWRPAARRAVSELARFLSMTSRGEGAEITLRTPTDLSLLETYRLLTLRPELADRLISSEIREGGAD